jgi:hypothetical protein
MCQARETANVLSRLTCTHTAKQHMGPTNVHVTSSLDDCCHSSFLRSPLLLPVTAAFCALGCFSSVSASILLLTSHGVCSHHHADAPVSLFFVKRQSAHSLSIHPVISEQHNNPPIGLQRRQQSFQSLSLAVVPTFVCDRSHVLRRTRQKHIPAPPEFESSAGAETCFCLQIT